MLNRKKMEQLMYDVYVAEATMDNDYQNFNSPEKKEAYINKVFVSHEVSQAEWDSSLSWYSDRIDLYLKMNDSVKSRLQHARLEVDAMVAKQNLKKSFDPSLLPTSYLPPVYTFSSSDAEQRFRFRLDSTEIATKITEDDFHFTFNVVGIPPSFSSSFFAMLAMVYSDTTLYKVEKIDSNKTYELTGSKYLPGDTITDLFGFVHLKDSLGVVPHIQFHNIYFGEIKTDSLTTDTLHVEMDLSKELLPKADTIKLSTDDSVEVQQPEAIRER